MGILPLSKRQLLFGAAVAGISAVAITTSSLYNERQEQSAVSQERINIIKPLAEQDTQALSSRMLEFAPSEGVGRRLEGIYKQLFETAQGYATLEASTRNDEVPEAARRQARSMLERVETLNAELSEVNAQLVQEFVELVDAQGQGGFVLVDFYDQDCNSCQELDENLAAGVAASDYGNIFVIKAEVVEYEALKMFKRTGSYPELQLLRVSDFQVMGISEGAITPENIAAFINKAVAGEYLGSRPEEPAPSPGI